MTRIFTMSAVAFAAICGIANNAHAGTYIVEETESRYLQCYNRVYVPAKVQVNTRGRLVRSGSKGFEIAGDSWNFVRNPPVYVQTRRVVEADHYTLVGTGCP